MADLEQAGLKLVAEGVTAYLADIEKANKATEAFFKTLTDDAQKSVAGLNDVAKAAGKVFDDVGDGAKKTIDPLDDSRKATDKWGDALKDAGKNVSAFGEIATGALRRIGEIAVDALGQAAEAALDFVKDSIKAAGDFEAGVNRFSSIAGDSLTNIGLSFEDVSKKALELGAVTQFSAQEALDAMTELAKGGVDVALIMNEATDATLALAAAGELELANAAEVVAKALGVWSSTGVTATDVSNLMAQAANASTVDVQELALGLYNAQGAGKAIGASFEEIVTTLALLAPGFSSASDAGTSLKVFLTRLVPTANTARDAMRELGLVTLDGENVFFDAEGNFKGLKNAAEELSEAFDGLSEQEKIYYTQAIFGQDAQRTAIMLAEAGYDGFANVAQAMRAAGTAAEQAAKRNVGYNFALESLMGSVDNLKIAVGEALTPALTELMHVALIPLANTATEVAQALTSAEDPVAELSAILPTMTSYLVVANTAFQAIKLALTGVVSQDTAIAAIATSVERAFGPTNAEWVRTFGGMIEELAGAIAGLVAVFAGSVIISALTAIGSVIATILSPIGLIVIGVAALGAAWTTNFGGIQDKTASAITFVTQKFNEFLPTITKIVDYLVVLFKPAMDSFAEAWAYIGPQIEVAITRIVTAVTQLGTIFAAVLVGVVIANIHILAAAAYAIAETLPYAFNIIGNAVRLVSEVINVFYTTVTTIFYAIIALINGDFTGAWNIFTTGLTTIWTSIVTIISSAVAVLISIVQTFVMGIINLVTGLYMALVGGSIIPDMVNGIIAWFNTLATTTVTIIAGAMTAILTAITSAATTIVTTVTDMVMRVVAVVVANLPTWVATLATWAREAWEWLVDALPLVIEQITLWVTTIITAITDALVTWIEILSEWAREAWEWLSDAMPNLVDYLSQFFSKIKEWAANVLKEIVASAKRWAEEAYKWVKEKAIPGVLAGLADFLSQMRAKFDDIKDQLRKKAEEIGEAIVNGIKNVIRDAKDAIVRLFVSVINAAISAAKAALGISSPSKVFEAIGEQTMQGFLDGVLAGAKMAKSAVSGAMKAISTDGSLSAAFNMSSSTIHAIGDAMRSAGSLNAPASASQITNQTIYNNTYNVNNALNYRTERSSQGIAMDWNMLQTFGGGVGV